MKEYIMKKKNSPAPIAGGNSDCGNISFPMSYFIHVKSHMAAHIVTIDAGRSIIWRFTNVPYIKKKVRWCLSRFYYKNSWNLRGFSHLQTAEARWWVCYWFKSNSRLRFCDCCCAFAFLFPTKLSTFWFDIECRGSTSVVCSHTHQQYAKLFLIKV